MSTLSNIQKNIPARDSDFASWQKVPVRVDSMLPYAIAVKLAHTKAAARAGLLASAASWQPDANTITLHNDEPPTQRQQDFYLKTLGDIVSAVKFANAAPTPDASVVVKPPLFPNAGKAWTYSNKAFGGPTPLSNAIVSSLLLGGLGYGVGTLAEQVFPDRYLDRGRLRNPMAIAGLLAGAGIGAMNAGETYRHLPENGYWRAWVTPNTTQLPDPFEPKQASWTNVGGPYIPVDAFNRATWADASKNFDQSSFVNHTSPQIAAATTGILSGLKRQTGSSIISPSTVISGLASAGVGLATATLAGKTIGALAGLKPVAQEKIQDMGLWGGMLHAVIPPVLGLR